MIQEEEAIKIIHDLKNSSSYIKDKHILDMKIDDVLSEEVKTKKFEILLLPLVNIIKTYKLSCACLLDKPIGANFEMSIPYAFWNPYVNYVYDSFIFKHQNKTTIKTYLDCQNLTQECILIISGEQFQNILKFFDSIQNIIKLITTSHTIRPIQELDTTTKWLSQFFGQR